MIVKKIFAFFVVSIIIFYGGYRLGLVYGTKWTMEILVDMGKFHVASRVASGIQEINEMKSQANGNRDLICKMKSSVMRQADDWRDCKANKGCAKEITGPFYLKTDDYILEFEKINCS